MFWNNFYNLCESNGVKPLNVVKSLSIAAGSITKWKNGTIPSGKTLQKISEYFNVSVDYLLGKSVSDKKEQEDIMFKKNFERICSEKGLSPTVVCEKIGITGSAYSKWNENSVPRKTTLLKLANHLDVSVETLLGTPEPKPASDKKINISDTFHGIRLPHPPKISKEAFDELCDEIYKKIIEEYGSPQTGTASQAPLVTDEEWEQLKLLRVLNEKGKKKAADYIDDLATNPKYKSDDQIFYIRTAASNGSAGMDESYKAPKHPYSASELEEIKKLKDVDDLE